jgi:hypothetical protein
LRAEIVGIERREPRGAFGSERERAAESKRILRAVICEEAVERRDSTREKGGRRLGE